MIKIEKSRRTERIVVSVLKALFIWSIQIFAWLLSRAAHCSFLDNVKKLGFQIFQILSNFKQFAQFILYYIAK